MCCHPFGVPLLSHGVTVDSKQAVMRSVTPAKPTTWRQKKHRDAPRMARLFIIIRFVIDGLRVIPHLEQGEQTCHFPSGICQVISLQTHTNPESMNYLHYNT